MQEALNMARDVLGAVITSVGLGVMLVGVAGQWRLPDVYTRVHAAALANGLGAPIVLLGLATLARDGDTATRALLLAVLLVVLTPVLSHLTLGGAHHGGLAPLTGAGEFRTREP
ncbi:MAG: monovalent cation/H(+) antiporter subunit G [Hyphomonadaceae bacterium]|nr:monovalent cation/H(+) antiporter subunit G [Hyphomonadaceae bacterium]